MPLGDLDIWIEPVEDNVGRVWSALKRFGAPVESLGVSKDELLNPDRVIQIGMPLRRIDILTGITGVQFGDACAFVCGFPNLHISLHKATGLTTLLCVFLEKPERFSIDALPRADRDDFDLFLSRYTVNE